MGVYIKGMEMPQWCNQCACNSNQYCQVLGRDVAEFLMTNRFPDDCPLISVPPHGDLIDKKTLTISTAVPLDGKPYQYVHIDNIKAAPTIIPADESDMDSFIHIFEEDDEEDEMDSFIRILKD